MEVAWYMNQDARAGAADAGSDAEGPGGAERTETVEATAGGGMVKVVATGGGEIREIKIDPKAIDRTTRDARGT